MGDLLRVRGLRPDRIVSSPACRAKMTADLIARGMGLEPTTISYCEFLYEQGLNGIWRTIHGLDDGWRRVFLIGHNPDLTLLINALTGENLTHLPTCGTVSLEFSDDSWESIMRDSGRLVFFDYPKRHKIEMKSK